MDGIRPEFGALFGPTKSIRAGENLFARDSAGFGSLRFASFARLKADGWAMSNIRPSLGFKSERPYGLLVGIFARPLHFNRAKQPPQKQWRIPSVLGVRITHRTGT